MEVVSPDQLPYRIEYGKDSYAVCRKCYRGIPSGSLRLAAMIQSFQHDRKDPVWFHKECFFERHRPQSVNLIDNFENVRYDDQKEINSRILSLITMPVPEKSNGKNAKKRTAERMNLAIKDFGVEYSKSARAECVGCRQKIAKHIVRVKRVVYDTEVGMKFGGQPFWHHLECFATIRGEYDFFISGDNLPGFKALEKNDQKLVLDALPTIKVDEIQKKKMKREPLKETDKILNQELETLIQQQSQKLFDIRDMLERNCSKSVLQSILTINNSCQIQDKEELLNRCSDMINFGALAKCQKCLNGDMIFTKHGYTCNGATSEWAFCGNFVEKPLRLKCKIPKALKNCNGANNFFASYKSIIVDRAVRPLPNVLPMTKGVLPRERMSELNGPRVTRERLPLYNLHVVAIGTLKQTKLELKEKIERLGGKLVTKLQRMIAVVISNENEVEKMNKRMREVKDLNIQVVPEEFLDEITSSNTIEKIKSMSICNWGSDPLSRLPQDEHTGPRESMFVRGAQKVANVILKNGTVVDPQTGLDEIAHVFRDEGVLYTSTLGLTDIQRNKNSFFKLQILKSDIGRDYWLFTSWGRIGTKVGDSSLQRCSSGAEAIVEFENIYKCKTGNKWNSGYFQKRPGCYYPIDVDYDDGKEKIQTMAEKSTIPSKLPKTVQDLVSLLFDIDTMKQTMMEFKLDLDKMPLGRLSKKQLQEGYQTLTKISELVARGASRGEFVGASNKFYTLIPHNFGVRRAPVIDTLEVVQSKREMIDNLMEIEIAYALLQADTDNKLNPVDARYEQLKTKLEALDHASEEFQLIQTYVTNTHAETHQQYDLEIVDVFKMDRQGEKRRYKPFRKLHNRQLLWHGSRLTNYVGILANGLKIAPAEAPVTGYMFGKGIYFADMVSKSANYCFTTSQNNIGLMLLSEVALGDTYNLTRATYVTKLPENKHSVKGIGKTSPDPKMAHTREDGVIVPLGKGITDEKLDRSSLLYNEYVVYDDNQVNVQYLLKMKFNYK